MIGLIVYTIAVLLIGFGFGRIKNSAKLAAIDAQLKAVEFGIIRDVKLLAEKIKSII